MSTGGMEQVDTATVAQVPLRYAGGSAPREASPAANRGPDIVAASGSRTGTAQRSRRPGRQRHDAARDTR